MQMSLLSRRQINPSKINFRLSKIRKGDVQKHTCIYIYTIRPKCKGLLVWTEETGIPVAWKIQLPFLTIAFKPSILNILFFFFVLLPPLPLPSSQYWNTSGNNSRGEKKKKNFEFNIAFCSSCKVNPLRNAISSLPRRFIEYKIQFLIVSFVLSISDILFFFSILKRSNKNSPWKFFISDVIDCSFQKLNGIESLN